MRPITSIVIGALLDEGFFAEPDDDVRRHELFDSICGTIAAKCWKQILRSNISGDDYVGVVVAELEGVAIPLDGMDLREVALDDYPEELGKAEQTWTELRLLAEERGFPDLGLGEILLVVDLVEDREEGT